MEKPDISSWQKAWSTLAGPDAFLTTGDIHHDAAPTTAAVVEQISKLRERIPGSRRIRPLSPATAGSWLAGNTCILDLWKHLEKTAHAKYDALQLSLTHTGSLAVAIGRVTKPTDKIIGIGVDLEAVARKVHPRFAERITFPPERSFHLSALELWVLKEAAFKSWPSNRDTLLTDYELVSWDGKSNKGQVKVHGASTSGTQAPIEVTLLRSDSWLLALGIARS